MKKEIQISGTYRLDEKLESFTGTVTFDEREDSICYSWRLIGKHGESIGGRSLNVALRQIPTGNDKFDFVRKHAIEGIKEYRIGRNKIIQQLTVDSNASS